MRRIVWLAAIGLLWATVQSAPAGDSAPAKTTEAASCGEFGTTVDFEPSPSDAARKALKEEKLVFVLHVSGLFEDSDFT